MWKLVIARDIMIQNYLYVTRENDLNTALERFTRLNIDELPVLDDAESKRLIGMLRRKETIGFYNRRLIEQKKLAAK